MLQKEEVTGPAITDEFLRDVSQFPHVRDRVKKKKKVEKFNMMTALFSVQNRPKALYLLSISHEK
jgi:hypothetical protein